MLRSNRLGWINGWYVDWECLWDIPLSHQGMSRGPPMCEVESQWVYATILAVNPVKDGEET